MNKKLREKIKNKYGGKCAYCGIELGTSFHVDHLEPVVRETGRYERLEDGEVHWIPSVNGMRHPERDQEDNYIPSCASCNIMKGSTDIEFFRSTIQNFIHSLNLRSTQYKFAKKYGLIQETHLPVKFYFEIYDLYT